SDQILRAFHPFLLQVGGEHCRVTQEEVERPSETALLGSANYRPAAPWPRSTMQVHAALAITRFSSSVMAHSTYPIVRPRCTTVPSALSWARQTGRKKLIFSSTVVKDSSGASVLANAIPIAASATSQRIPPCNVPMGFACCGPADKVTVARPSAMSLASNPIRRATATSFAFARSLKSG